MGQPTTAPGAKICYNDKHNVIKHSILFATSQGCNIEPHDILMKQVVCPKNAVFPESSLKTTNLPRSERDEDPAADLRGLKRGAGALNVRRGNRRRSCSKQGGLVRRSPV